VLKLTELLSTKDKILHVLKINGELTIKEVMDSFTISEIAVRKHMNELIREKFISRRKNSQEIGRPFYTYFLTDKGHDTFPSQEKGMSLELLEDLEDLYGEEAVSAVLNKWKEREQDLLKREINTADFDERVNKVAKLREQLGYMVKISQSEDGDYTMKHFNCPVSSVACTYNQLCIKEKEIFKEIFNNSEVTSTSMITKGDRHCTWEIKRPKKAEE